MNFKKIGLITIVAVVIAAIAIIVIVKSEKNESNTSDKKTSSSTYSDKSKEKDTDNTTTELSSQNKEDDSGNEVELGNEFDPANKGNKTYYQEEYITEPNNGRLIVNGKDITNECYVNFYKPVLTDDKLAYYEEMNYSTDFPITVAIPMGAVTKELGATVTWQGNIMTIHYKDWETELSKDLPHLGVPVVPSNYKGVRRIVNNDFIVDISSLLTFFNSMDAEVNIDRDNMIIYIDNR